MRASDSRSICFELVPDATRPWFGWGVGVPFQIDAIFGMAAAVLEMLVFSKPGLIKFLPALARWPSVNRHPVRRRGGLTLDLAWDMPAGGLRAGVTSDTDQRVTLKLAKAPVAFESRGGQAGASPLGDSIAR